MKDTFISLVLIVSPREYHYVVTTCAKLKLIKFETNRAGVCIFAPLFDIRLMVRFVSPFLIRVRPFRLLENNSATTELERTANILILNCFDQSMVNTVVV